jgi:exodeoxyribonuclease VIII
MIRIRQPIERQPAPEPGIYEDVPFEEYLSWDAESNSGMRPAVKSMAHYRAALDDPIDPTPPMRFGNFTHVGRLEPLEIPRRYVVMPRFEEQIRKPDGSEYDKPKATKAYREKVAEFEAANGDKEIVPEDWYAQLLGIVDALTANPRANVYLNAPGPVEVSLVWDDPSLGVRCKARLDKWAQNDERIIDVKTTANASDFQRTIAKLGYHRQGAFYSDGLRVLTGVEHDFCLVAMETTKPFGTMAAPLSPDAIEVGRRQYRDALSRIVASRESDTWPGYENPAQWELPAWAASKDTELIVDGEIVTLTK